MTQKAITALNGAPDLYAALRASGFGPDDLDRIVVEVDAPTRARLGAVDQGLLRAVLRGGSSAASPLRAALQMATVMPLFRPDIGAAGHMALPTGGQRPDMPAFSDRAFDTWFADQTVTYGLGLYGENRTVYATAQFADAASPERRTVHLGIDVFAPAGTPMFAPLAGRVRHVTYNADPLDYGNTLILDHDLNGLTFHTLYGHLGSTLPDLLAPGDTVAQGQLIAHLGDWGENGGWAPHVHFQIMTTMLEQTQGNFFGVGHSSLWDIWAEICPDPNLILRLPDAAFRV
ncbi:MAG: peptidoglycan DD-metalloendopeptidase family protein [Gemmobacter sp.]|nr:peptidoglycan DD-metalloendopeptidase family protein [Gemmobacter sp.]